MGVHPGLQPVGVERGHVAQDLQGLGRGIAVAAIAEALDVAAVDHVAAPGQVVQGIGDHVVDPVQVLVVRSK